jgi:AI-2 transport protein TqsA
METPAGRIGSNTKAIMGGPQPPPAEAPAHAPRWRDPDTLRAVVFILVGAAAGWYLMQQLAPVLRPLLIAAFLAYVLMPYHSRLRRHVGTPASITILAGSTAAVLVLLAFVTYASVAELAAQAPALQRRAGELFRQAEQLLAERAPWLAHSDDGKLPQARINELVGQVARPVLNFAADAVIEACVVALYLLFLLLEGARLPGRIRKAYPSERADEILHVAGQVNAAIVSYLKAKVKSSLVLALPAGAVLWALGVKFPLLWAVLTFLCNFIPYIGSVVAYSLPVGFAFLWFGPAWQPFAAAGLLLACHLVSASVLEPLIIGSAVGVSPLVILGSLAFWGLVWGIPGMFLAVPLTVVAILVMEQFDQTRPVARLLKGG